MSLLKNEFSSALPGYSGEHRRCSSFLPGSLHAVYFWRTKKRSKQKQNNMQNNSTNEKRGHLPTAIKATLIGCFATSLMLMSCGSSEARTEPAATITESTEPGIDETHFKTTDLADLDLSANGIPLVTKAPKGAKLMKYDVDGSTVVYGGKNFKLTFSKMDGTAAENHAEMKEITGNKEVNLSFDKFEVEDKTGFIRKDKSGKLTFLYYVDVPGGGCYEIVGGMPFDLSPDKFFDYTPEDMKVMYEAAKATAAK
jgi:hypothetical protein